MNPALRQELTGSVLTLTNSHYSPGTCWTDGHITVEDLRQTESSQIQQELRQLLRQGTISLRPPGYWLHKDAKGRCVTDSPAGFLAAQWISPATAHCTPGRPAHPGQHQLETGMLLGRWLQYAILSSQQCPLFLVTRWLQACKQELL